MAEPAYRGYVRDNLAACAAEIMAWRRRGVLPNGHVRHAAGLVPPDRKDDALQLVEYEVTVLALQQVAGDRL